MKDMKPNREPAKIVNHGDSRGETEAIESPSSAFQKVDLHTTHHPSAEQEGEYTCNCGDIASTTLLDRAHTAQTHAEKISIFAEYPSRN